MTRTTFNPWLNRFAVLTAGATLCLIGLGGLVTSHGVGMAVPDWPTTYGYNMFLFPPSQWIGGVFYEHTHRLAASFVGLLTTILAAWLWLKEARVWLRWLGLAALLGVVLQGILGGVRVTLLKDQIGIFHAALAQLFFVLVCLIALFTSRWWQRLSMPVDVAEGSTEGLRWLALGSVLLVFMQLVLGGSMRHQHAGLAIPDFPLAYGRIWPPMDAASLEAINRGRLDVHEQNPITALHIVLHMAHRSGAIIALFAAGWFAWKARRQLGAAAGLSKAALAWFGLLVLQAVVGAATVLSNKAADVATAHVLLGAVSLVMGSILYVILILGSQRTGNAFSLGDAGQTGVTRISGANTIASTI